LREVELPWFKPRYITPQPLLPRIRKPRAKPATQAGGEEGEQLTFIFVKPKNTLKSLREEEELSEFLFIKPKR
jgi:hypothetical protein